MKWKREHVVLCLKIVRKDFSTNVPIVLQLVHFALDLYEIRSIVQTLLLPYKFIRMTGDDALIKEEISDSLSNMPRLPPVCQNITVLFLYSSGFSDAILTN